MDCYIHQTQGRLRFRLSHLQGNALRCQELREAFLQLKGILGVKTNARTGSILLHFDPRYIQLSDLFAVFHHFGYLENLRALPRPSFPNSLASPQKVFDKPVEPSLLARELVDILIKELVSNLAQHAGRLVLKKIFS